MRIPLGPWAPDQARLGAQGLLDVRNAIPAKGYWLPQRGLQAATDHTLTGAIQGIWATHRLSGDYELFVSYGGKIYLVGSRTADMIDVTGSPYDYDGTARWRGVQFGDLDIRVNGVDETQARDLNAGGDYTDLAAGEAPISRYIALVRDFPVWGFTTDDLDGTDAYRVAWPGLTNGLVDPTNWTDGQSDFQRVQDIGQINGLTGGWFGSLICEAGVATMQYGGSALFAFEVKERRIGCRTPTTVNEYRGLTVFYSPEAGWCAFDGTSVRPIGVERIDRWFADDFDENAGALGWTDVDSKRGHMLWAYCGRGHGGRPNRLLRYSVPLDEWAVADIEIEALGRGKTFGLSLDDIPDMDLFTGDLEDPALWSSLPDTLAVAGSRLSSFAGDVLTARFETGEFQLGSDETRAMLRRALVLANGGTATLEIASRERFDGPMTWSTPMAVQSDGWFRCRIPGRSHAARVSMSGAWADAQGVDLFPEPLGKK
jgi:hypothetical protein